MLLYYVVVNKITLMNHISLYNAIPINSLVSTYIYNIYISPIVCN